MELIFILSLDELLPPPRSWIKILHCRHLFREVASEKRAKKKNIFFIRMATFFIPRSSVRKNKQHDCFSYAFHVAHRCKRRNILRRGKGL